MSTFVYKAKRGPREVVEGELEAADANQAIAELDGLGLTPITIHPKGESTGKAAPRISTPRGIRKRHVNNFVRSLANLVKAKVPILKALKLLEGQSPREMKAVAADLAGQVAQGASLSQAMERHGGVFPRLLIGMVRGGEASGLLGEMLEKTAEHEEKSEDLRRRIRGAMAYPLFVLTMGGATIFILMVYFMPRLMETYLSNKQELPWPTEVTLAVSGFLSGNWYWILGVIILFYALAIRKGGSSQGPWDALNLQLPFIKSLVLKNSAVSFSRTLGLLLAHGVPLVKGVPLAAETVGNRVMGNRLKAIEEKLVRRGSSLGAALKEVPGYPSMAASLVTIGEESGHLAATLDQVALQYEKDVEGWLKVSTTLVEPVMILLVGGVIGFVVFAMLMPIFQMDVLME